jgi:hypothetical protein
MFAGKSFLWGLFPFLCGARWGVEVAFAVEFILANELRHP